MSAVNNRIVLLYSGGIDSTVLMFRLINEGYQVYPLYINYGQITYDGELEAINNLLPKQVKNRLLVISIPEVGKIGIGSLVGEYPEDIGSREEWFGKEFFPNRNMILIAIAASYCCKIHSEKVAIGVVGKNSYPDTSSTFIANVNSLLCHSLQGVQVIAPYAGFEKMVVIKDAISLGVSLEKTFSCNSLGNRHCQLCTSCLEREYALNEIRARVTKT